MVACGQNVLLLLREPLVKSFLANSPMFPNLESRKHFILTKLINRGARESEEFSNFIDVQKLIRI